jgi:hypothetical protein
MYSALNIIKHNGEYKVKATEKGEPLFKSTIKPDAGMYSDFKLITPKTFLVLKRFVEFYGPSESEY